MDDYPLYKNNVFVITPLSTRITLEPGQTYNGYIEVGAPTDSESDVHYKVTVQPYSEQNYDDEVNVAEYSGILDWITIEQPEGVIARNSSQSINYTINVPEDAVGGGQYVMIAVQNIPTSSDESGTVQIKDVIELSSILYITINGEVIYDGDVPKMEIPEFSFENPIAVKTEIANTGNIHQDALIKITAKNHFTGENAAIEEVNKTYIDESKMEKGVLKTSYLILPGETKEVDVQITGLGDIGVYDVYETVYYNSTEYTAEQTVIMCPTWLIGAAIGVLVVIIGVVAFFIVRKITGKKNKS